MDYPKSVPSVGLVDGKFVDENPVAGTPGSLIPASWGNAVTEEILGVIKGGALKPDEADAGQLLTAVRKINQAGLIDFALDTGTANAYAANYSPAPATLTDGMVLRFKALNTNTGASTFSVAGSVAKPLVGLDHTPLRSGEIVATGDVWVQWNSSLGSGAWILIASTGVARQLGADVGDVKAVATVDAPSGWLKCNGQPVLRTQYANLFAAIGTRFGAGDGANTFNLPDLRGEFVRGLDEGRGVGPGRVLGSKQAGQNASHVHDVSAAAAGNHAHTARTDAAGLHAHGGAVTSGGAFNIDTVMGGQGQINGGNTAGSIMGSSSAPFINRNFTTNAPAHSHGIVADGNHAHNVGVDAAGQHTHTISMAASGGNEARPMNTALLYVIKF